MTAHHAQAWGDKVQYARYPVHDDGLMVHSERFMVEFESNGERKEGEGWTSDYYGEKRSTVQTEFVTNSNKIITTIKLK